MCLLVGCLITLLLLTQTNAIDVAVCSDITVDFASNVLDTTGGGNLFVQAVDIADNSQLVAPGTFEVSKQTPPVDFFPFVLLDCGELGENSLTLRFTPLGQTLAEATTCLSTVTVIDTPIAPCSDSTKISDSGKIDIVPTDVLGSFPLSGLTGCGLSSINVDPASLGTCSFGENTVTLTATSTSGDTNSCEATITVEDSSQGGIRAPTQNITVNLDGNGQTTLDQTQVDSLVTELDAGASFTVDRTTFDCGDIGNNGVILTVTKDTDTQQCLTFVSVLSGLVARCKDVEVNLNSAGTASIEAGDVDNGSSSNCGAIAKSISEDSFTSVGEQEVTLTVRNNFGESASCTAKVNVRQKDTSAPSCISKQNLAHVKGKGQVRVDQLIVGDYVAVSETSFSKVVSLAHKDHESDGWYQQIFLQGRSNPLEITGDHLLWVNGKLGLAKDVTVGDLLSNDNKVVAVNEVKRRGLYAPITEYGRIMISGVQVSCFVSLLHGVPPSIQEYASWSALAPLRLVCSCASSFCENETFTAGYSNNSAAGWVKFARVVTSFPAVVQMLILLAVSPLLILLVVVEQWFPSIVLLGAWCVIPWYVKHHLDVPKNKVNARAGASKTET